MTDKMTVSVIVPVYNTIFYIKRCVESIIKQTYGELEIVLVDDGSTDGSGEICDELCRLDKRVKVIHKKNGGLSEARNEGIELSKGEFLVFVDSDDWLPRDAIEMLYNTATAREADIVSGELMQVFPGDNVVDKTTVKLEYEYDATGALEDMMFMRKISNSASGKIYKKKLFKNIRYPVGKLYEDLGTTYKLFAKAKKIIHVDAAVYYYFQRGDSIMHQEYVPARLDAIDFAKEELSYVRKNFANIVEAAEYRLFYESMSVRRVMPRGAKREDEVNDLIKKYRKKFLYNKNILRKRRFLVFSSYFGKFGIELSFGLRNTFSKCKRGN